MPVGGVRPSVGLPRSRFRFPVGVVEVLAAAPAWNKSLRAQPRPAAVPLRRRWRVRGGGSPALESLYRSQVCCRPKRRAFRLAVTTAACFCTGGAAMGVEAWWPVDLGVLAVASSDPGPWRHGVWPRLMDLNGVVLVFSGGFLLRLLQSFQAMVLPSVSGCWLLLLSGSGVIFHGIGLRRRRLLASLANREIPKGFFVICVSLRGSCVSLAGTAVLCTGHVCVPVSTVFCMVLF